MRCGRRSSATGPCRSRSALRPAIRRSRCRSARRAGIATGAPMPPGADAVVPVEDAEEIDGALRSGPPRGRRPHPARGRGRGVRSCRGQGREGAHTGAARGGGGGRCRSGACGAQAARGGDRDRQRAGARGDATPARPDLRVEPDVDRGPVHPGGRGGRRGRDRRRRSGCDRGGVLGRAVGRCRRVVGRRLGRPARSREGCARRPRRPRGLLAGGPQAGEAALVRRRPDRRARVRRPREPRARAWSASSCSSGRRSGRCRAPRRSRAPSPASPSRSRAWRHATTLSAAASSRAPTGWSSTRPVRRTRT